MRRLALLAVLAACNPYDPDLGSAPFRCGTDEPRCPDGYVAVDVSVVRCECRREDETADAGGSAYVCDGDPFEPNDAPRMATPVDLSTNMSRDFVNLAICPRTDVDHFSTSIARAGSLLVVRVVFDTTRSAPRIDITDENGTSLRPTPGSPQPGVVTAELRTGFPGVHVARIAADLEVNYDASLTVTPPENP
jgi:hypothetical protein